MSIPWLPVFFKNRFLFITPAILGSPVCGSNGLTVSIFPRFMSTLPDAFTGLPKKSAKFYSKFRTKRQQRLKIFIMQNPCQIHSRGVGG